MRAEPMTINTQPGHLHMQAVCDAHGLTPANLRSWNKCQPYVTARKDLWLRLVVIEGWSYPQAGRMTCKDHTTALYGLRRRWAELTGMPANTPTDVMRLTWECQIAPALQAITTFAQALAATREPVQVEPEGMGIAA